MVIEEEKIINTIPVLICKRDDRLKKPIVIFSHGFTGSKLEVREKGYLKELAQRGCYAVAIDNRLHGGRPGPGFLSTAINSSGEIDLYVIRKAIKDTADDVKLLIDELSVLEEVDRDRIAMMGVSMGGYITYRSMVIDDRISVGIPIISSPFWGDRPGDRSIVRDEKNNNEFETFIEQYQPSNHLDKFFPRPILMQIGDQDEHYDKSKIIEFYHQLKEFYANNPENLSLIVYPDTKHVFSDEMWKHALKWLKEKL